MTVYEKIKALLELNTLKGVLAQHEDGEYHLFYAIDGEGSLVCANGQIKYDASQILYDDGLSYDGEINDFFTHDITPIPHKPKILPVGTKVRILDIVKEVGDFVDWRNDCKQIKRGTITRVTDSAYGVYYCINGQITIPAYAIVPDFGDENTEKLERIARIEKELEELKKEL